jgi:hypothetical protein
MRRFVAALLILAIPAIVVAVLVSSSGSAKHSPRNGGGTSFPSSSIHSVPTLAAQAKLKPRYEVGDVRAGIRVYRDNQGTPANASDIPIGQEVLVVCRAENYSGIGTINYFYLLATPPWRGLFASANQFANGQPVGVTTNAGELDPHVKPCIAS